MGNARHVHGPVTTAKDGRFADGGLLAVQGPTAIDTRTGVLVGPGSTTLVTGTSSTAPMTVAVAPHHWVTSRGAANGPYLGALEATALVTIPAAPAAGTGTRIDVVYSKQQDAQPGIPSPDLTTAPLYGVVSGVAGGAKPALPVGAEELATVAVSPGATATNGANVTITNTARQTVARGGILPLTNAAERTALQTAGGVYDGLVVAERDTDRLWLHTGSGWRYIGGGPPPTKSLTVLSGWNPTAGRNPQAYLDASGLVHLQGVVENVNAFTPTNTQILFSLPSGIPAPTTTPQNWKVLVFTAGTGVVDVMCQLTTAGNLVSHTGPAIPAGSFWYLDGLDYHPTMPGSGQLA